MADRLSTIAEAIRQASEAYAQSISMLSKTVQSVEQQAAGTDRERLVENSLRLARMGKDGMVSAIEQGFEMWEREIRRIAAQGSATDNAPSNPMEKWAESWRNATDAFSGGGSNEEFRRQAEAVQNTLAAGIRAWQNLWQPEKK